MVSKKIKKFRVKIKGRRFFVNFIKKQKTIKNRLVGCLNKKGKKTIFENTASRIFLKLSKTFKLKPFDIMSKIKKNLISIIDVRTIKMGKQNFLIPIPVKRVRRNYLVVKKVLDSQKQNKEKISLKNILYKELSNVYLQKNSRSVEEKINKTINAVKNKGNAHFRW